MARLESQNKMGYYPTPAKTLDCIMDMLGLPMYDYKKHQNKQVRLLDPCCGRGQALAKIAGESWFADSYGIELDGERALMAAKILRSTVQSSIFDTRINPLGMMSLLFLNPPYDFEEGERSEMKFLKHAAKWLCPEGVLVFIVPEYLFDNERYRNWIGQNFHDMAVFRCHSDDFPRFRQVVLFGKKNEERVESGTFGNPPYPFIEDACDPYTYEVPVTPVPDNFIFQGQDAVTEEDIAKNETKLHQEIRKISGKYEELEGIRPILPPKTGHLVSLATGGLLDKAIEHRPVTFEKEEFQGSFFVDRLCEAIESEDYPIAIDAAPCTVDWLNELISIPELFDIVSPAIRAILPSIEMKKLVSLTSAYRRYPFAALHKERQRNIQKLNRFLLQTLYPAMTPELSEYGDDRIMVVKGYSARTQSSYVDEDEKKEITTDTFAIGIRVIELDNGRGRWYDIR